MNQPGCRAFNPGAGLIGALEAMRESMPDMVLLDIMMPGRTGLSLYASIRRDPDAKGIPVVIISGYARKDEFKLMDLVGPDSEELPAPEGYLEKPISVPGLLETLERILARPAKRGSHV